VIWMNHYQCAVRDAAEKQAHAVAMEAYNKAVEQRAAALKAEEEKAAAARAMETAVEQAFAAGEKKGIGKGVRVTAKFTRNLRNRALSTALVSQATKNFVASEREVLNVMEREADVALADSELVLKNLDPDTVIG